MSRLSLAFALWLAVITACARQPEDSIRRLLSAGPDDSTKVLALISAGQAYEATQPGSAKQFYYQASLLSRKINYPAGVIKYIINYTAVLNTQGAYDSSVMLNLEGVTFARKLRDSLLLGKSLFNTGIAYRGRGDYQEAIRYCLEGERIFERLGHVPILAQCDNVLQVLYTDQGQLEKAEAYGLKAVGKLRRLNMPDLLSEALINLAIVYKEQHRTAQGAPLLQEALQLARKTGNTNMQSTALINLGDMYLAQNRHRQAKPYMAAALPLFREVGSVEGQAIALRGMAICAFQEKDFTTAQRLATRSLALTAQHGLRVQHKKNLLFLSDVAGARHDLIAYDSLRELGDLLADSLMNDHVQEQMLELETKYETEKKESAIRQLHQEKALQALRLKQKATLNYLLAGTVLALAVIGVLAYRNFRQRRKLQETRIQELETEKQLLATEALLEGEEKERGRLARELHDGLGGMLSGIRHTFQRAISPAGDDSPQTAVYEKGLDMLDSSIRELRRVAHNMTPDSLLRFGLDQALEDFCAHAGQDGQLQLRYQSFGLDTEPGHRVAIAAYRIVQELVHNILKHAGARNALVQAGRLDDLLVITVEDDGRGTDTALLRQARGIGWHNIHSRVQYLKGSLDIRSEAGKGMSVHIELPDHEH